MCNDVMTSIYYIFCSFVTTERGRGSDTAAVYYAGCKMGGVFGFNQLVFTARFMVYMLVRYGIQSHTTGSFCYRPSL